jgi:hypothetical protein
MMSVGDRLIYTIYIRLVFFIREKQSDSEQIQPDISNHPSIGKVPIAIIDAG